MKRHHESRFPFLNWRRLNDTFHVDTFFPSVKTAQNHTCGQTHSGEKTGHWEVYPLKKESHAVTSLQDFFRIIGIPNVGKRENSKTQTGEKWKEVECNLCIQGKMTGPHSPCQIMAEHGVRDLGATTTKCMDKFSPTRAMALVPTLVQRCTQYSRYEKVGMENSN